jgi:hypothetical protein
LIASASKIPVKTFVIEPISKTVFSSVFFASAAAFSFPALKKPRPIFIDKGDGNALIDLVDLDALPHDILDVFVTLRVCANDKEERELQMRLT